MKKLLLLCVQIAVVAAPAFAGEHDYYNMLLARPEHWKSWSLRSQAQINQYSGGEANPWVTYNPSADTYPVKQDAAKVVVPDFVAQTTLTAAMDSSQTTISVGSTDKWIDGRGIRVDGEVMKVITVSGNTAVVTRGVYGTPKTAHAAGTTVYRNTNSLPPGTQVWVPMNTENGHTYVTTWDAWYGDEMRSGGLGIQNWKNYQFRAGINPKIWFEVQSNFASAPTDDDVAQVQVRSYPQPGPNAIDNEPLRPMVGTFIIKPRTWVRYWQKIDQRADGRDYVSLWVADANNDPVQILDRLQMEAGPGIAHFDLEFNTSHDRMTAAYLRPPLTIYVRNIAVLRDVADIWPLLQRPGGSAPAPSAPIIQLQPIDRDVVVGSTLSFSASAAGSMPLNYQWQAKAPGSSAFVNIPDAVYAGLVLFSVPLSAHNTQYRCVISNSRGTVTSNVVTLGVYADKPPSTNQQPPSGSGTGTLTLSLPAYLPINSEIAAKYSGGTTAGYYSWTFSPRPSPSPSSEDVSGASSLTASGAPSPVSFNTPSPVASLSTSGLELGTYLITVTARASSGNALKSASAQVTLVSANLDQVHVYPNPWRSDRHGAWPISFGNLAVNTEIKIFTVSGQHVGTLPTSSTRADWDLKNQSGDKVASGIYMYVLKAEDGSTKTGKLVIIK